MTDHEAEAARLEAKLREIAGREGAFSEPCVTNTMVAMRKAFALGRAEGAREQRDVTREAKMRDALACVVEWFDCAKCVVSVHGTTLNHIHHGEGTKGDPIVTHFGHVRRAGHHVHDQRSCWLEAGRADGKLIHSSCHEYIEPPAPSPTSGPGRCPKHGSVNYDTDGTWTACGCRWKPTSAASDGHAAKLRAIASHMDEAMAGKRQWYWITGESDELRTIAADYERVVEERDKARLEWKSWKNEQCETAGKLSAAEAERDAAIAALAKERKTK